MTVAGVPLSEIAHLIGGPRVDDLLRRAAREKPQHLAMRTDTEDLSYVELDARVDQWVVAIRHALAPFPVGAEPVVALAGTLDMAFATGFFAISRAGGIPALVNPLLLEDGLTHVLSISRAAAAVVPPEVYRRLARVRHLLPELRLIVLTQPAPDIDAPTMDELLRDAPAVPVAPLSEFSPAMPSPEFSPEAVACLQFTSGTTGPAKAVRLSHRNLCVNAAQTAHAHHLTGSSVLINTLPTFHLMHLMIGVSVGATHVLWTDLDVAATVKAADRCGATHFYSLPMQLIRLAQDKQLPELKAPKLAAILCGGSALPPPVTMALTRHFGVPVAQGYGLQETSPSTHFDNLRQPKIGSSGLPVAGTECRIVDMETREVLPSGEKGEIEVRGPQVMLGYLPNDPAAETPKALSADDWFSTGDVGYHDEDGYLFVVDRIKDVFKCDNWLVSPTEIERVLRRHPGVADCVVVDYPDDISDSVAYALIQPRHRGIQAEELAEFTNSQLPYYEHLRYVDMVRGIPRSATGKVLRKDIRTQVRTTTPQPVSVTTTRKEIMYTFINRFTVTGDPAEFERLVADITSYMILQPGFRSHRFYQSAKDPLVYTEIAEWDNAASHQAATRGDGFLKPVREVMRHATADPAPFVLRKEHQGQA